MFEGGIPEPEAEPIFATSLTNNAASNVSGKTNQVFPFKESEGPLS